MLMIKTYLDKSPISGIGVFASEFVKKGDLVWQFHPLVDIILTSEQLEKLPSAAARKFIEDHSIPFPFGTDNHCTVNLC